jgi:hypothetical protein
MGYVDPYYVVLWNNLQPDFTCPRTRVGGHGDGPKMTCGPHRLLTDRIALHLLLWLEGGNSWLRRIDRPVGYCIVRFIFDPGNTLAQVDPEEHSLSPLGLKAVR